MALDDSATEDDVVVAVKALFLEKFPEEGTPNTSDAIAQAMAEVIAGVVTPMFDSIRNNAEVTVTNVQSGVDTAPGTIT